MTVRAHTNIALIKYWGKKDEDLKLPYTSSLSLTLDQFYTETSVVFDVHLESDQIYLDGMLLVGEEKTRVVDFLNRFRLMYHVSMFAWVRSENHVPRAAGLASSASAFAALAAACAKAAQLDLDLKELSALARLGSGSAARSIYGGFSLWKKGTDHVSSHAVGLDIVWDDFVMIVCVVNAKEKKISSTEAMRKTALESPYFAAWVEENEDLSLRMQEALSQRDIVQVGKLAQKSALLMHASILSVGISYFEPLTIELMQIVLELQKKIPVYFTMDAGPNLKIMTTKAYCDRVLKEIDGKVEYVVCKAGPGVDSNDEI